MKHSAIVNFILIVFLFMSFGCDKEDEVSCIVDCKDAYLQRNGMVSYTGGETGCKSFIALYEFENKQYYLLGNNCADLVSYPTDCDGNKLCENGEDKACSNFYQNARFIGIVGIEA